MIPYSIVFFVMELLKETCWGTGKFYTPTWMLCLLLDVFTFILIRSSSEKFRLAHWRDDNWLLTLTAITLWKDFEIAKIKVLWLSKLLKSKRYGAHTSSEFSAFSVVAGWIAEVLFMLFYANTATKRIRNCWNQGVMAFKIAEIEEIRVHTTSEFSAFSLMAEWIAEVLFMLFYAYTAVCVRSALS